MTQSEPNPTDPEHIPQKKLTLRLTRRVSLECIERWATNPKRECVYAIHTPWWSLYEEEWMPYNKGRIPCDPRGSGLMQSLLVDFWEKAKSKPDHYGSRGLDALVAAFHSNVEVLTTSGKWLPTSLDNWEAYCKLLDEGVAHVK